MPDETQPAEFDSQAASMAVLERGDQPGEDVEAAVEPAAEEVANQEEAEQFETPFSLDDVPETYREHVERYAKQLQGAYTRKTQELADQRKTLLPAIELGMGLLNEDTQMDAFRRYAESLGYAIPEDEEAPVEVEAREGETQGELEARLAAIEEAEEARQIAAEEAEAAQAEDAVYEWVEDTLDWYAEQRSLDELPAAERQQILANAAALPRQDGIPDMKGAIEAFEAQRAHHVQAYVQTKDAPALDASGASGVDQVNLADDKQRLKAMEKVASRHYSSNA